MKGEREEKEKERMKGGGRGKGEGENEGERERKALIAILAISALGSASRKLHFLGISMTELASKNPFSFSKLAYFQPLQYLGTKPNLKKDGILSQEHLSLTAITSNDFSLRCQF